jgi:hypothetical protein
MAAMTPGAALRQLQQAQAALRKTRKAIQQARANPALIERVLAHGWESLASIHRLLASIPFEAVNDPVLTQQLSVQRSTTAVLVRLRRLARREDQSDDDPSTEEDDE